MELLQVIPFQDTFKALHEVKERTAYPWFF